LSNAVHLLDDVTAAGCPQLMSWTALRPTGSFAGMCGEEDAMVEVAVIGIDLAKSVFQVHGIDAGGRAVLRQAASQRPQQNVTT
jgi:hypothetical protein